jgi:ATP/maltotriose-dependent transcriptional regulator MalT
MLLGKVDKFLAVIEALPLDPSPQAARTFCLAHAGHHAEVTRLLEESVLARPGFGTPEDGTAGWQDVQLLESAVIVGHDKAASLLLHRLANSGMRTTGWYHPTVIARHLGGAAALLGRPGEARAYYQDALKVATEMRFRPEIALTRLQLAELLLEHYPEEKSEALEHLDFAINEFQDMKMQPSLESALRHKEILGA